MAQTEPLSRDLDTASSRLQCGSATVTAHTEGQQLFYNARGCTGGRCHRRLMTPHAYNSGANMDCCFCLDKYDCRTERSMGHTLQQLGLDNQTVWQYQPPFWAGRVDFFVPGWQLHVQVDGDAHFTGTYRKLCLSERMHMDVLFNTAAWRAGAKVVRVHHKDLGMPGVAAGLQLAATYSQRMVGPFLLLSPGFRQVRWRCEAQQQPRNYVEWMCRLFASCGGVHSATGWVCLQPLTL